jgi:hypothetical protein
LEAIRISARGRFEFRLTHRKAPKALLPMRRLLLTLQRLGVRNAQAIVAHSMNWGPIKIAEPD